METTQPPIALWIVGEPGVGKSTLVRALIAGRPLQLINDRCAGGDREGPVRWTVVDGGRAVVAGHYDDPDDAFPGADRCDRDTRPMLAYWSQHHARSGVVTVFDGDRFAIQAAKVRVAAAGASLRVVHLVGDGVAALRRSHRGDTRKDVDAKRTKYRNFAATFAADERLVLDASEPTAELIRKVVAWLPALAPDARVPAVAVREAANQAPPKAPLKNLENRTTAGAREPREAVALEDGTWPEVQGEIATYVQKIAKRLVKHQAVLGIYRQGDRIVEVISVDGAPRVYELTTDQVAIRIDTTYAIEPDLENASLPREARDALEKARASALPKYASRVLALRSWPGMRPFRGVAIAPPGRPAGYDDATGYYYTRDTRTELIEARVLALYKALAETNRGYFTAASMLDSCLSQLQSLPCAAYSTDRRFADKTMDQVVDLEDRNKKDTGVLMKLRVHVLDGLRANRPVAIEYTTEGEELARYELVYVGKSREVSETNPITWRVETHPTGAPHEPTEPDAEPTKAEPAPPTGPGIDVTEHTNQGLRWRKTRTDGVLRIDLVDGLLSDSEADCLVGRFVDDSSYALRLGAEAADVYKPDGTLLLSLRKRAFPPSITKPALKTLRHAARASKNRGAAAGIATAEGLRRDSSRVILRGTTARYVTRDGVQSATSESNEVDSGIVGYFDSTPRNPYCRETAFTAENGRRFGAYGMPLIQAINRQFAAVAADRHDAQRRFLAGTGLLAKGWTLGDTVFTTVTVNRNFRTAVHKDSGDYAAGFGNLTVIEGPGGSYEGGALVFPKFRVAVDVRSGDFLAMDVHEHHGNTEMRGTGRWERVSVVCYAREAMAKCGTMAEEHARRDAWLASEQRVSLTSTKPAHDAKHWPAFLAFARELITSGDLDPTYPVLRHVFRTEGITDDVAVWRLLLYVTTYHLGSAVQLWSLVPRPQPLPRLDVPPVVGSERKGFRGAAGYERARRHIEDVLARSGDSPATWLRSAAAQGGELGWRGVRDAFEAAWGAGPWASYKLADLLRHVLEFQIAADDLGGGTSGTSGPIPGLALITGIDRSRCARDGVLHRRVLADVRAAGVPLAGLDQLETCLCKYLSSTKGRYCVGHDIEEQREALTRINAGPIWWAARAASFPATHLAEQGGGGGVDAPRRLE